MRTDVFIVDTNVVVAGLLSANRQSPVCLILDAMLDGRLPFLLSPALLGEYRRVLLRPRLVELHGLDSNTIDDLLTELTANTIWREPPCTPNPAPDPGDDHLWALLASQPHSLLVTGDRLLLNSPPRPGTVISPGECAARQPIATS